MPLISVPAVYDGKEIKLLESPPVKGPYHVVVTFVEPTSAPSSERDLSRFWASFGAWKDERTTEEIIKNIHESRRSRREPPKL
jgi:hypothetical protein